MTERYTPDIGSPEGFVSSVARLHLPKRPVGAVFHGDQPLLVYAMEVDDEHEAARSAASGTHPIDVEHQAVMQGVVHSTPRQEIVLDLRP